MENLQSLLQEIENEQIKSNVLPKLDLLLNEINFLILKIKFCQNAQEAEGYFDLLDKIQLVVATLQHKYGVHLSKSFKKFIVDFGRLHEAKEREQLFNAIKKEHYTYESQRKLILLRLLEEITSEPIKINLLPQLDFIYEEVCIFFNKIKMSKNVKEADVYFDFLEKIQDALAELSFKYNIKMPENLNKFIRDYDRLDDPSLREYLFDKIKNGSICP